VPALLLFSSCSVFFIGEKEAISLIFYLNNFLGLVFYYDEKGELISVYFFIS
jgi:hypothetical protein